MLFRSACILGGKDCCETDPCSAHEAWKGIRGLYVDFLEKTTLAGIAGSQNGNGKGVALGS